MTLGLQDIKLSAPASYAIMFYPLSSKALQRHTANLGYSLRLSFVVWFS